MTFFLFTLAVFACYRLSHLLALEEGPASLFTIMRRKVPAKTNAGKGIRCPLCWSVWIGILIACYYGFLNLVPWPMVPVYLFAVSGVTVLLHKLDGED